MFSRKRMPLVASGMVIITAAAVITFSLTSRSSKPLNAAEQATSDPSVVRTSPEQMHQLGIEEVKSVTMPIYRSAVGQIAFNEDASTIVLTPFSGRVTLVLAKLGDEVRRGDPLFEIDSAEVVQMQTDLIAAAQAAEKTKSQMSLAKRVVDRQKELLSAKAASLRDFEQAQNEYAAAESDHRAALGSLVAARNRLRSVVGRTDEEVAKVERDRVVNPLLMITAPIDGTVVSRKIGPGQYVRSDAGDALYGIADLSTMWLKASVPETDISGIRVGQPVEVTVPALAAQTFDARITAIGASSDAITHRVVVRSEIENQSGLLKPEMFARFRILIGKTDDAPAVPVEAIVREAEKAVVWVEVQPTVFQRRLVKLGAEYGRFTQIVAGVASGDRVVGRGAVFLENEWRD